MRRSLIALITILAMLGLAIPVAGRTNDFTGAWEATDTDASHLTLAISGGGSSVRVLLFDDYASFCAKRGVPGSAIVVGEGTITSNGLHATFAEIRCQRGLVFPGGSWHFTYNAGETGEWLSGMDVLWYRPSAP